MFSSGGREKKDIPGNPFIPFIPGIPGGPDIPIGGGPPAKDPAIPVGAFGKGLLGTAPDSYIFVI